MRPAVNPLRRVAGAVSQVLWSAAAVGGSDAAKAREAWSTPRSRGTAVVRAFILGLRCLILARGSRANTTHGLQNGRLPAKTLSAMSKVFLTLALIVPLLVVCCDGTLTGIGRTPRPPEASLPPAPAESVAPRGSAGPPAPPHPPRVPRAP